MADKWDRSIQDDFNKSAEGKQQKAADRSSEESEQVKNTRHGLHDGPPPPKGPGMAVARQQHREAMAKDHELAAGKNNPTPTKNKSGKGTPKKGDLKKDFDRSR